MWLETSSISMGCRECVSWWILNKLSKSCLLRTIGLNSVISGILDVSIAGSTISSIIEYTYLWSNLQLEFGCYLEHYWFKYR